MTSTELENVNDAAAVASDVDQNSTAQDAPVEAPSVDVKALTERAQGENPIVFGLMQLIIQHNTEFAEVDKQYQEARKQGETPVAVLLEKITDDPNAVQLKDALDQLQARFDALKAKARELLAAKGLSNEAAEAELKTKRDEHRAGLNKAINLLSDFLDSNDQYKEQYGDFLTVYKPTRANAATGGGSAANSEELAAIRTWAKTNGIEVADRGRIAQSVIDKYRAANPQ